MSEPPKAMSDELLARVAALFRAAGDIGRLRLLSLLVAREATVTELATLSALPMSTVSQQLKLLRSERLVARRRAGKRLFYSAQSTAHVLLELATTIEARERTRVTARPR